MEALWHSRKAHRREEAVERMMKSGIYEMTVNSDGEHRKFDIWAATKAKKKPRTSNLIEGCPNLTVPTNVCWAVNNQEFGGKPYFVTFTLTPHWYVVVKLIKHRSEVADHCRNMISWIDQNSVRHIKRVQSDNAKD